MAIHRLLQHSAFSQDDIDRMVAAYEDCLKVLRLTDRSDPAAERIAKQIIEIAQTGVRDPTTIRQRALDALGFPLG
jgi:hypothetical protein